MARFLILSHVATDGRVIVNTEAISCILPEGAGSRVFLLTGEQDKLDVREDLETLARILAAEEYITGD